MANTSVIVIPEGKICDYVDGKFRNDTPEEYVRQTIEKRLVNEHKYLPKQIRIEYTLQLGSRKPRADIVIFDKDCGEQTQENIKIMVVEMINPGADEKVLDSSCGTGGFLVIAMTHVIEKLEKQFEAELGMPKNEWSPEAINTFRDRISEMAKSNYFGFDKRVYVDEGYGRVFFGGKQLFELDPTNTKYLSISKHDKRMKEELELKENLILITRSGTIGKTVLVPKHWENWVASEDVLRIAPASAEMAGYLYIYLLSDYGAKLVDRCAYGSVISHIDDTHIYNLPVPLLKNSEIQQKINSLAIEANQKRYEAYKLEQKALEIMDKEVIYAK